MPQQYAKISILALLVLRHGMAAFRTDSACVASSSEQDEMALCIDSGASKSLMSDMSLNHSFDEVESNVSFRAAASTMITYFACCWDGRLPSFRFSWKSSYHHPHQRVRCSAAIM